ncbi:MAG: archaeosortase/exosortase family protein [Candidatus Aenigmatarchaeota archaeon]
MRRKTRKQLLQVFWFLVKFNLLAIPLYLLLYLNFSYKPLQNLVAFLSYKLLLALGTKASLDGSSLKVVNNFTIFFVEIDMDCTGWKSLYALFSLTMATPFIKLKKKLFFLLVALPSIFFFNIVRIALTAYIYLVESSLFEFIHDFLWKFGLIFAILASWILWLKYEKRI